MDDAYDVLSALRLGWSVAEMRGRNRPDGPPGEVIGMPSHAVDEAWHGLILCTARYAAFCEAAYGRFLHHHPEGSGSGGGGSMEDQLARTVIAWSLVADPAESCVLWDLDARVGVEAPWGVPPDRVAAVEAHLRGGQLL